LAAAQYIPSSPAEVLSPAILFFWEFVMNEPLRTTRELRCPFLDCKSKQIASVGYDNSHADSNRRFDEHLFQCQECERKFLFIGKL
jgi:hypothetical protein